MRKSILIATTLAIGGGATSLGATLTVPTKYFGSDALTATTQDAITAAGISSAANYLAGGSGAGQSAMAGTSITSSPQQTAPMSKMLTNGVCTAFGGTSGSATTNASGIVIGLDAVDIFASNTSGTTSACSSPSSATQTGDGLVYSGTTGVFSGATTNQNWKWALALLYGGLDLSAASGTLPDCNSSARNNLVSNWSKLFQNGCSNATNNAGVCGDSVHGNALWHAFRLDDTSGTNDVFSSLIGLQTLMPSPSASSNNGFGATPFCNALNFDTNVANNGGGGFCNFGLDDQFVGPGGIPDPNSVCVFKSFSSSAVAAAEVCTGAPGSGNHRQPPPGVWGNNPIGSNQSNFDVLPTSYQDNDPIRRPCVGNQTGNVFAEGEEICNLDGKLGLVLSIPFADQVPALSSGGAGLQYPTVACNTFKIGKAPNVFNCPGFGSAVHPGECPDGDSLIGGGCETPVNTIGTATSQCSAIKATIPALHVRAIGSPDGRAFNLHLRDGDVNDGSIAYIQYPIQNGKATPLTLNFVGGAYRIHALETIWNDGTVASDASQQLSNPPNVGCQLVAATDEIGCLTQADPCSVGIASDSAKTWNTRTNGTPQTVCAYLTAQGVSPLPPACSSGQVSDSIRIDQTYPVEVTVSALGTQAVEYQVARKLYFNSIAGFPFITAGESGVTDTATGELALGQYEAVASNINPILTTVGLFPLANQTNTTFNSPFCEDFNQQVVCNPTSSSPSTLAANDNACGRNTENSTTGIPSDPSTVAASSTTSTVCGNGVQETYEECDDGLNNGTTGDPCSNICRCAGTKSYENTGSGYKCQ
jgi:hypothetical protein